MPIRIRVVERILQANDDLAGELRTRLDGAGLLALNLMASPGAGKTLLIQETVNRLRHRLRIGYVNGDIATSLDAERVAVYDLPVVQINTGGDCHLYINHLEQAREQLGREPQPLPTMKLNPAVQDLFAFRFEDFTLEGYAPHPHIKAAVAI